MSSIINATTTAGVTVQGDNSGSLQLATNNGTTALTIDTSQNVGIGTSSPAAVTGFTTDRKVVQVTNNGYGQLRLGATSGTMLDHDDSGNTITTLRNLYGATSASAQMQFQSGFITFGTGTSFTERMRIDSSGLVYVNTTATIADAQFSLAWNASSNVGMGLKNTFNGSFDVMRFLNYNNVQQGYINCNNSGSTTYNSGSDYRFKDNVQPMTNGLSKVMQLKPVTFNWKGDNSAGQGFIAHELAEIVPDIVSGEKDAVTEDGTIKPQGVDYGKLTAVLTSAIQELKAELDATKAEVQALKGTL